MLLCFRLCSCLCFCHKWKPGFITYSFNFNEQTKLNWLVTECFDYCHPYHVMFTVPCFLLLLVPILCLFQYSSSVHTSFLKWNIRWILTKFLVTNNSWMRAFIMLRRHAVCIGQFEIKVHVSLEICLNSILISLFGSFVFSSMSVGQKPCKLSSTIRTKQELFLRQKRRISKVRNLWCVSVMGQVSFQPRAILTSL